MDRKFYSLGLMSGTSMDGIDASIIYSNGVDILEVVQNKYFKYDDNFINKLSDLKNKINTSSDLKLCLYDLNKNLNIKGSTFENVECCTLEGSWWV